MDLLLCSARDPGQGAAVTSALTSALEAGKLGAGPFGAAVQRVTALRNSVR
jgi:beta-N-acetylhexosaminidase